MLFSRTLSKAVLSTLNERINELQGMAAGADISRLPDWQEDMHWLMLILGKYHVDRLICCLKRNWTLSRNVFVSPHHSTLTDFAPEFGVQI